MEWRVAAYCSRLPDVRQPTIARKAGNQQKNTNGANLGFEATLWQAADKLRNNLDAATLCHALLPKLLSSAVAVGAGER
jgi:hypothetical protein